MIVKEGVKTFEALNKQLKIEMLLFSKQKEFQGKFPGKWIPSNFKVVKEPFSEDNQMINSTLKMVRHKITETSQNRLDLMYGAKAQEKAQLENIKMLQDLVSLS